MKVSVIMMAALVSLGLGMAQSNPPDQPKQAPDQPKQAAPQTAAPATTANPDTMNTKAYKGVLVDMSCASRASVGTAPASTTPASTTATTSTTASTDANTASRSGGDAGSSCPVSASSTELGMKMNDGRTVRFDLVGNQRAQDGLKNNKHWTKDLSAGKPIHATVLGALNGDKLIVSSIN